MTAVEPKSHFPTDCNPASPACGDPALPTHITSHRTEIGSSRTSSTSCPRLSLKSPRNLKPSCDLSITIQGSIFWTPLRLMTSRAGFFPATRLERRPSEIGGPCCIAFAFAKSEFKQGLMIRNIVTQAPEDYCQGKHPSTNYSLLPIDGSTVYEKLFVICVDPSSPRGSQR